MIKQYPHQLSGGMRQRVMIAMAIACNPEILIADEPTTALDVTVEVQILELINDLKNESNAAIIFISHDLGVIAQIADNVAVMYSGRIVEYADVEVYQQLATKLGYLAYATDKEPFIEKLSVFNKN